MKGDKSNENGHLLKATQFPLNEKYTTLAIIKNKTSANNRMDSQERKTDGNSSHSSRGDLSFRLPTLSHTTLS
jgi:hypothetical protein